MKSFRRLRVKWITTDGSIAHAFRNKRTGIANYSECGMTVLSSGDKAKTAAPTIAKCHQCDWALSRNRR